jgi:hypothetical protein
MVSLFDLSLQIVLWSTQNRLLYIVEEENTADKKARAEPPKPPVFEELKIICLCVEIAMVRTTMVHAHTIARIK